MNSYIRDGQEIYKQSFEIIRSETDLSRFEESLHSVVVRIVHACGMPDVATDIEAVSGFTNAARSALQRGATVLTDSMMLADGVTRSRLPAENEVICTLRDPRTADLANELATTRSAAAVDLWADHLKGSVVAIGNAPTALYRLLEMLGNGAPTPAAIVGMPVGFVGAAESKEALIQSNFGVPYLVVRGRRGGSAMAAAAINAVATVRE